MRKKIATALLFLSVTLLLFAEEPSGLVNFYYFSINQNFTGEEMDFIKNSDWPLVFEEINFEVTNTGSKYDIDVVSLDESRSFSFSQFLSRENDSDGNLHLVYSNQTDGTVYYHSSNDQGTTWSTEETLDIGSGNSYILGLDALLSNDESSLLVSYLSRAAEEEAPVTLNWVELDPQAQAGSRWGDPETIANTVWPIFSWHGTVSPKIRLDADGIPYLSTALTTAETPSSDLPDEFAVPKIALFRKSVSSWEKHWLDLSQTTNGLDYYGGDDLQFDWSIDNTGDLHILFQELTWSDTSFRQEYFFSNPDLLKVKYSHMELDSMEFN